MSQALGKEDAAGFCAWFGVEEAGNFAGRSIPQLLDNPRYAQPYPADQLERLARFRRQRLALHRDDKVLTGWNGLMIAALARGARVLGEERYLRAGADGPALFKDPLTTPEGQLLRRWRDREAAGAGQLEDYAYYLWGLLELYAAHFSTQVLREAAALADRLLADFWDEERAGFYPTAHQGERLIARPKETYDGALPSGNAVAALALLRLGRLTAREEYRQAAQRQLAWLAGNLRDYPAGHTFALLALLEDMHPGGNWCARAGGGGPRGAHRPGGPGKRPGQDRGKQPRPGPAGPLYRRLSRAGDGRGILSLPGRSLPGAGARPGQPAPPPGAVRHPGAAPCVKGMRQRRGEPDVAGSPRRCCMVRRP